MTLGTALASLINDVRPSFLHVAVFALCITCSLPIHTRSTTLPIKPCGFRLQRILSPTSGPPGSKPLRGGSSVGGTSLLQPVDGPGLRDALLEGGLGRVEVLLRKGTYEVQDESLEVHRQACLVAEGSGEGVTLLGELTAGVEGCEECSVSRIGKWESPLKCCVEAEGGRWKLDSCVMSVSGFGEDQAPCVVEVSGDAAVEMGNCSIVGCWREDGDCIDLHHSMNAHGVRLCGYGRASAQDCTFRGVLISVYALERAIVTLCRCTWNLTSICAALDDEAQAHFDGGAMSCIGDGALFVWNASTVLDGFAGVRVQGRVWAKSSLFKGLELEGVSEDHDMRDEWDASRAPRTMQLTRDEEIGDDGMDRDSDEVNSTTSARQGQEGGYGLQSCSAVTEMAEVKLDHDDRVTRATDNDARVAHSTITPSTLNESTGSVHDGIKNSPRQQQLDSDIDTLLKLPIGAPNQELDYLCKRLEPLAAVVPRIAEIVKKARDLQGRKENDLEWLWQQSGLKRDLNVSWPYEDELPDHYKILLGKMRRRGEEVPPVIARPSPEQQERDIHESSFGEAWREVVAMEEQLDQQRRHFEQHKTRFTSEVLRWAGEEEIATSTYAPETLLNRTSGHSASMHVGRGIPGAHPVERSVPSTGGKPPGTSRPDGGKGLPDWSSRRTSSSASGESAAAGWLPPGWVLRKSQSSGKHYYMHLPTGKTQWERPSK